MEKHAARRGWAPRGGLRNLVEAFFQRTFALEATHLVHDFALFKKEQSRYRRDTELDGQVLFVFGVYFGDLNAPVIFLRKLVQYRSERTARRAVFAPKIDENRRLRLEHFGGEVVFGEINDIQRCHNWVKLQ